MKKWAFLFAAALLLSGCSASREESNGKNGYQQISGEEAAQIMAREENYILLDVRTREEYENGHIPGAICLPNETIGSEEIPELPDKDQLLLIYCRSGNRSKQAAEKLAALGYTNIMEFGGIMDWTGDTVTGGE